LRNTTSGKKGSSHECARCVLDVTPPVGRVLRQFMRHHRLEGLSVPQFRALALLSFSPKASLSLLADHVGSSLPAASRMVDGLVAKKLIARQESSNDRRQVSLALTPRGMIAFRESRQATHRQLTQLLSVLTASQRQDIIQSMKLLAGIFGSDADILPPQVRITSGPKTKKR
jgi:DNA-binding MarR family transcriptional regulator